MKNSSNLNISCKVVFSLNKWNKKLGSPSSFGRKRPFISLNSSAFIENLSSSERTCARARANHAINDAQKGCAMQLNGITLSMTMGLHSRGLRPRRSSAMINCMTILRRIIFPNISLVSLQFTRRLRLYSRQQIAGLLILTVVD